MSKYITSVSLNDYNQSFSDWKEVTALATEEDVATFIDTFEKAQIMGYSIIKVVTKGGKYIFVTTSQDTGYDLIAQLNNLTPSGVLITSQNVKLLFGKDKSRGYYVQEETVGNRETPLAGGMVKPAEDDDSKTDILDEDDDESATGFMDEDDYIEHGIANTQYFLVQKDTGERVKICDSRGVTIGRSSAKVDYVLRSTKVSRKHARVYLKDDVCMVADCESYNGTFVNGLRLRAGEDAELPVGGSLLIGDVEFTLSE